MIGSVSIGTKEVWIGAYNPSDDLAKMYCAFVLGKMVELLDRTPVDEVHAWLREHFPATETVLAAVEEGKKLKRDVPIGEYPVSPGAIDFEKTVANYLQLRKRGMLP